MVFALGSRSETLRSDDELAPYRHSCCWALVPWLGFSSPSTEPYQEKPPSVTHAHRKLTLYPVTGLSEPLMILVAGPRIRHQPRPCVHGKHCCDDGRCPTVVPNGPFLPVLEECLCFL